MKDARRPVLSPDGRHLAYFRWSDGSLWLANGDGSGATHFQRGSFPGRLRIGMAACSPDSSKLAVVTLATGGDRKLWTVPVSGGDPASVPLANGTSPFLTGRFSWLPDDRHILIPAVTSGSTTLHLYSIDTKTGEQHALTAGPLAEMDAAISPDGRRTAVRLRQEDVDIFEFSLETGSGRPVVATSRPDFGAVWAPSGREFAYVSERTGHPLIWTGSDTGLPRPILFTRLELGSSANIAFSPDGQRIAFDSYGIPVHRVMVASVVGGTPVVLDPSNSDNHDPSFSPDGSWIAYSRYVSGETRISKIPSGGGGTAIDLMKAPAISPDFPLQWSPAGDWIAYSAQVGRELVVVTPDGKSSRTLLKPGYVGWTFNRDGSRIYGVRRDEGRMWDAYGLDVASGAEHKLRSIDISPQSELIGFSLHPDGKRFLTTVRKISSDIWIVEGLTGK